MAQSGYYKKGAWNFVCDTCGSWYKSTSSFLSTSQNGGPPILRVCPHCVDVRNPQEFVRPVADPTVIPWSRPLPNFIFTDVASSSSFPRVMDAAPMDSMTMG